MFSNLANYLLGSFLPQQDEAATPLRQERVESNNLRLTPEDDWILVDRDSEGNSEVSSMADDDDDDVIDEQHSNYYNSTALLPYSATNIMDESWFVTPPPCFISTEPVHMETSPLENLLIEHPSMSVYAHHIRRHNIVLPPLRTVSPLPPPRQDELQVVEVDDEDIVVDHIVVHRRINRMQLLQQQEKQLVKMRQAQKIQIQKACQHMKRSYLERNNKAREVNSRNQRQRRGERSQGPVRSHANNNRKC